MMISAVALLVVLGVLMVIGMPITWALGGAVISAILLDPNLSLAMITQKIFTGCDNFSMLALPAFFLAGDIMAKGGLSKRLVSFADTLVGWISGGISLVSLVACAFFAAISGSSVATTAATGSPACRTRSPASSGIAVAMNPSRSRAAVSSGSPRSAAVNTRTTPDIAAAPLESIAVT